MELSLADGGVGTVWWGTGAGHRYGLRNSPETPSLALRPLLTLNLQSLDVHPEPPYLQKVIFVM